ncbi:MAG: Rieske 2Fe-2S domain-containing protein [Proteobacteria bacterium]|nr:Rieske 2Fe-2S domain-containing protein [Pseudomonadota bacterium]
MKPELVERLRREMHTEFERRGPPEGFPALPDIPAGRYTSREFYELELEHLWPKSWLLVGRTEELPESGSYFVWDALGTPFLVIRGQDGEIRAFFNSCQHRGAPVVREPCGRATRFRCQYHSWTYDTTGKLVSVPDERDFVDLDRSRRGLRSVRCEVFDGWIFINQDPEAIPLLESLGPIPEEMAQFQGQRLRTVDKKTRIIPCNWKVVVDAFNEVYHFKHIHSRDGFCHLDNRGATMGLLPLGHSRMIVPLSEASAARQGLSGIWDWKPDPTPGLTDIATVNAMVRCTSTSFHVFPNLTTPVAAHGFPFLLSWPIDERTTRFEYVHYAPDWGEGDPPPYWAQLLDIFEGLMDEDTDNMAPMQQSLDSPGLAGIPLNYQERRIRHVHEQIDRVIGPDRIPAELRVGSFLDDYVEP